MARSVQPPRVVNIADLRRLAKRRLPRVVFDYIDGGADGEITLRENCRAFDTVTLPSPLRRRDGFVRLCGRRCSACRSSMPLMLAPVGSSRMFYPRGEEVAARAAGGPPGPPTPSRRCRAAGWKMSRRRRAGRSGTSCICSADATSPLAAMQRARAAGFSALVVTIDTPVAGLARARHPKRHEAAHHPQAGSDAAVHPQFLMRPGWLAGFLGDGGMMKFPNVVLPGQGAMPYADVGAALEQSMVCWQDLRWIRDAWSGPIVVKGVHTGDDARRAVGHGSGRRRRVQSRRPAARWRGGDACASSRKSSRRSAIRSKSCSTAASGAAATSPRRCASARAPSSSGAPTRTAWAPPAEPASTRAIDILRTDLVRTMKLLGCASVAELDASYVDVPADWLAGRLGLRRIRRC